MFTYLVKVLHDVLNDIAACLQICTDGDDATCSEVVVDFELF